MAYRDDILALGADHHWDFDGDSLDQIGSVNGTDTSIGYSSSAIAEDAVNCAETNSATDRISIPTTTNINNSAQTRKAVSGWFLTTAIQTPPKRIYGEGNETTVFQFVMSYGNNIMFECVEPTNFTLQVFGPVLQPNRAYHLCGIFEGNGYGNIIRFFVDGILQTDAEPVSRQPGTADLDLRGVAEFADPAGTVGIGGAVVIMNAPVNGQYNHWATFDGANAVLTDTEVRDELFEKGVLPGTTIASGTQAVMQTTLDGLASSLRPDEPLNIRINAVTGDGNFELRADNVTHNALASIHIQYMGTGTLTWVNTNGSDTTIGSVPSGGTIVIANEQTLTVTVKDATDRLAVQGARVYIEAASGGDLAIGTVIMNSLTDVNGIATQTFDYTNDQPILGRIRQGTSAIYYKEGIVGGPLTSATLNETVLLVPDE